MKRHIIMAAMFVLLTLALDLPAQAPKVVEFRTQNVNQKTYFHVRIARPADMAADGMNRFRRWDPWWDMQGTDPSLRARLVPQDDAARLVYTRDRNEDRFGQQFFPKDEPKIEAKEKNDDQKPVDQKESKDNKGERGNNALDFYGVINDKKEATFLLIYPKDTSRREDKKKKLGLHELLQEQNQWVEVTLKLDPAKAKKAPAPNAGRRDDRPLDPNDLEGHWALAQAMHFAQLEAVTPEFGFYGFAHETTNRQYKIRTGVPEWWPNRFAGRGIDERHGEVGRLYEVTTGAAAITESLALERLRDRNAKQNAEARSVPIADVRGIEIDEHPWVKMMGAKKPAPEPLAEVIPHDNYYLRFKTFQKFLDTTDLLDQWGTSIARAFEVNSRDHRIKQKLEQQLCLRSTGLARVFGPAVIKSLAITGNDPYLREGSDLSVIFQINNKTVFAGAMDANIAEARKKFGKLLSEGKEAYQGVTVETFTTPTREVSLHRAFFADYAVCSNSGVALKRIIDAHNKKSKRLSDSLDFQYMRTVFRADDGEEDGFVFMSDAFIRNLVGPQVRIKERRRLEALTSMHMLHHGAMFAAWESGKLPQTHQDVLAATGMNAVDLFTPDGAAVAWNGETKTAVSTFYNTLHFATPLIEIPITHVTPTEAREYEMFRAQYLGLWRQYFDPIGIRLALKKDQIKMETYILPLVRTTQYNELRRIAGDGTVKIDSTMFSDKTLFKYLMHISPQVFENDLMRGLGGNMLADLVMKSWLGDWFAIRFDDSPVYAKLLESHIRSEMFPDERRDYIEDLELALQMPITIGFDIRSPVAFAGVLTGVRKSIENTLPGAIEWGPMKDPYKGVQIVRIRANGDRLERGGIVGPEGRRLNPEFYYAMIDGGFFLSLREEPIKDLIDRSVALKDRKDKGEKIEVNSSLYLGPKAAVQSKDLLKQYLEWETHRRAQFNNRLLYALFKSNIVTPAHDSPAVEAAALQYLGFVPVSPDLAPFRYDSQKEEVINLRHGSVRQPKLAKGIDARSQLSQMLEEFASIRADLRFREDGIHTTLTMNKIVPAPINKGVIENIRGAAYRTERRNELRQIGVFFAQFCETTPKDKRTLEQFLTFIKNDARQIHDAIKKGYYKVNLSADPNAPASIIAFESTVDRQGYLCVHGDASVDYVSAEKLKKLLGK